MPTKVVIMPLVGTGDDGYSGDGGPASNSKLYYPRQAITDSNDNLYIADDGNRRVRFVNASTKIISTVVGSGEWGFDGDNDLATSAKLRWVPAMALDSSNNIFVCDKNNHRIRKVTATSGVISTIAGSFGNIGDGGASTSSVLYFPQSIAIDSSGRVLIADTKNHRIRRIDQQTGIISSVAGMTLLLQAFNIYNYR